MGPTLLPLGAVELLWLSNQGSSRSPWRHSNGTQNKTGYEHSTSIGQANSEEEYISSQGSTLNSLKSGWVSSFINGRDMLSQKTSRPEYRS